MSQPEANPPGSGLDELRSRRERRQRTPPPPRHPKPLPSGAGAAAESPPVAEREIAREVSHEIPAETTHQAAEPVDRPVSTEPAGEVPATPARPAPVADHPGSPLPSLDVDLTDAAKMIPSPTVLSIPAVIMGRFEVARASAPSHTGLVLNALRAHARALPDLVLERRPGPRPGDLFPYRAEPGAAMSARPLPLRIRPTVGELEIMDALTAWVNEEIKRRRPGGRRVSRSEVVAVALDAFLPQSSRKR